MAPEIIGKQLHLDGFIYYKNTSSKTRTYWTCVRSKPNKECKATAITVGAEEGLRVMKGSDSDPAHPPNREESAAKKVVLSLKRVASENSGMPPAQILRNELPSVSSGILSQLPDRENLKKSMRRERRRDLPKNPMTLTELGELPDKFTKTLLLENFVLYDPYDEDDQDDDEERAKRILVFGTRRNLEFLGRSSTWFLDGTFDEVPGIFVQMFTISGLIKRTRRDGEEESVAFPLVYALLPSKLEIHYIRVLEAIQDAAETQRVAVPDPERVMADFEKAIINSVLRKLPDADMQCCFFHLGQSMYRKVSSRMRFNYISVQTSPVTHRNISNRHAGAVPGSAGGLQRS